MSEEYEVHGPHDHAVEHAGHHDADPFASRMAVMTAILATIGALCAYQSGNSENLALFYKNEAAIKKTEASNQWNYYQAKGEKENLAELGAALSAGNSDAHAKFLADVDKYKQQKDADPREGRSDRKGSRGQRQPKRSAAARPSSLGTGHAADPGRDCAVCDHVADAQELDAQSVVLRGGGRRADRRRGVFRGLNSRWTCIGAHAHAARAPSLQQGVSYG